MKTTIMVFLLAGIIFGCNNPEPSADNSTASVEANNKARFQQFYDEVMNDHDLSKLDEFIATGFVDHNPTPGHSGKGLDAIRGEFTEMLAAFPDMRVKPNFFVASGDTVVAHVTMSGTQSGPMMGMPPTNKSFTIEGIDIIVMKDGKATERWGIFDNMSMMSQLGMMGGETPADSMAVAP